MKGISIITPVFNRLDLLKETAQSVLNQKFDDWEWILVDDGSDEITLNFVNDLTNKDSRIKMVIKNSNMKGAPVCRNIGMKNSKYDFLWFLDSDDLLDENAVINRMNMLEKNPNHDFWVVPVGIFRTKPHDLMIFQNLKNEVDDLDRFCFGENVWQTLGMIWRKEFLISLSGFNENLPSFQDWELSIRALISSKQYHYENRMIPDAFYRQTEGESISNKRFNEKNALANTKMIVDIFGLLKKNNLMTETRRISILNFYVSRLNYWVFIETDNSRLEMIKKGIVQAEKIGMIKDEWERKFLLDYLLLYVSRFNSFFKRIRKKKEDRLKNDSMYLKFIQRLPYKEYRYKMT